MRAARGVDRSPAAARPGQTRAARALTPARAEEERGLPLQPLVTGKPLVEQYMARASQVDRKAAAALGVLLLQ